MSVETITLNPIADSYVNQSSPTFNYGGSTTLQSGSAGASTRRNSFLRFDIPNYKGVVKSIKLRVYVTVIGGQQTIGVHLMDSPFDDLWIEGVSNGVADPDGCSWDEYLKNANWPTPGGDFADNPIGMIVLQAADPVNQYYDIDIPVDNFSPGALSKQSFVMTCPDDTVANIITFQSRTGANKPELVIDVEVEGFSASELTITPVDSTELEIEWDESELDDDNFKEYLLEQSDTGVGGWTTLATITDKETVSHNHDGLVVQGDIDDYDEDSDTYVNGRTKYYRLTTKTNGFGDVTSAVADGTTVPAIRPAIMSYAPESKYSAENFIDDNVNYNPYGVNISLDWYDDDDITIDEYIGKTEYELYYRQASSWPGTASATEEGNIDDFTVGYVTNGDVGHRPLKIKGKVFDTGGLYRKFTTNKTSEQFEAEWPAPAAVAYPFLPGGASYNSGDLVEFDLATAGQQSGEKIWVEDFLGTLSSKWTVSLFGFSTPAYTTGVGGAPVIASTTSGTGKWLYMVKKGETYLKANTGGYRIRMIFRYDNWDLTGSGTALLVFFDGISSHSEYYTVRFLTNDNNITIWSDAGLLLTFDLTATNHPLDPANQGKFFMVDVMSSPRFGGTEGDLITCVYNIATTLAAVTNINYDTHPWIFTVSDSSHNHHYTGVPEVQFISGGASTQTNALVEIYDVDIEGRVEGVSVGQGFGMKNLITGEVFGLSISERPFFPVYCEPDQVSQNVDVECRVKNKRGSQSRTDELDVTQLSITNSPPVAVLLVPSVGYKDASVILNGTLSSDPEGGALLYEWDYGDGSPVETTASAIIYHVYTTSNTFTVKLKVKDETGLWSSQVESDILITDAEFTPLTFICPEPFTDIAPIREDGDTETPISGHAISYYQNNKTGGRKFAISGVTVECANLTQQQLIDNAQDEIDLLDLYYKEGTLVEIDLPNYGTIKGFISSFRPKVDKSNPRFWSWTMTFKEVDIEQLGG